VELEDSDDESLAHILQGRITSYNTKVAAPSVTVGEIILVNRVQCSS